MQEQFKSAPYNHCIKKTKYLQLSFIRKTFDEFFRCMAYLVHSPIFKGQLIEEKKYTTNFI